MREDWNIPEVTDVGFAVVREKENDEWVWNVYLINYKNTKLVNVFVSSKGYGIIDHQKKKTTTISRFLGDVEAKSYRLIEPIMEDVFGLSNEYFLTFYIDGVIYDKKFVFVAESIREEYLTKIKIMGKRGVLIK